MKFTVALFASSAMAGIAARDATIVTGVITTVGADLDSLTKAVNAYSGDKTDLVAGGNKLVSDLQDGKTKVNGGPDLTLNDAVTLAPSVQKLADSGTALTTALTGKKDAVEKAGECKTVQDQVAAISTNSQALIDAVLAKVPPEAKDIAQKLADPLIAVLGQAQDSYKDCTNASGGSSSTGSATGSSTGSATGSATGSSTGSATGSATSTAKPTSTGSATTTAAPTGTGSVKPTSTQVTVPTGAAAAYAPAGVLAAVVAALAL